VCRVQNGIASGRPLAEVLREARVWGDARQSLVGRAARNFPRAALLSALEHAAAVDRMVKGIVKGDAWDELLQLGLRFAA
jgi:DNA polymerase III subunit delta